MVALAACALWILPNLAVAQAPVIAITGATVIDGTGARPLPNATVVIDGDRIACVGECQIPAAAEVIDASGRYIIPGLMDAHVHYELSGWVDAIPGIFGTDVQARFPYPEVLADLKGHPERFHRSYLCSGVTAVFNTGGYAWTLPWREEAEHSTAAPHITSAGPVLTSLEQVISHPVGSAFSVQMTDEATVRSAVRRLAGMGSDAVKIHRPDLIEDPERRRALLNVAGEEARRHGMRLIALPQTLDAAKDALRAGASLFVYPVEDALVDEEFMELARQNDLVYASALRSGVGSAEVRARDFDEDRLPLACVDPQTRRKALLTDSLPAAADQGATIIPEQDDAVRQRRAENLRRVHAAGIPVAIGSGSGAPLTLHGPATVHEMKAVAQAGLTSMQVLVAATRNGARAMGRTDIGTLEEGKIADLVVLGADPLADISHVERVELVVRGGRVWTREELEYR